MRTVGVAVQRLECLADALMHAHAARDRQLVVERLADQRVGERISTGLTGNLGEDPRGHGLLERVEEGVGADIGHVLQNADVELAPGDGSGRQGGVGGVGQSRPAGAR